MNFLMLSPVANRSYITSGGSPYISDGNGIIANVAQGQDVIDLQAMGCFAIDPPPTDLLFKLLSANFNSTADQLLTPVFAWAKYKYRVRRITVDNTTVNGMGTAAGGLYTGAGKTGSVLVAAGQTYTGLTNPTTAEDLTINLPNLILTPSTPVYFSLTTAQGSTALADIRVWGDVLLT